ncbi:5-oxoprolinase subunit PxpB [Winogradskyella pulchriflava]|uniref:5-oxoprolinase subunit PxpB n=1 Tax=Winogradskyella pulchriflava TaxID=1110688 RepID=A0ABV6Q952_9FLAO
MEFNLQYSQYNEHSILIKWPEIINENNLKSILKFKNGIEKKHIKEKVEIIITYSSILIIYKFTIDNINDEIFKLKSIFKRQNKTDVIDSSVWEIPVCYDTEFGVDLEGFSKQKKLSKDAIIELHSGRIYTVYFIGFLPGFLYLGGLDSRLFFDRKSTPNLNVKKGSVAIGGEQTGIYPQDSPGGWHIIGKTPISLFNSDQNPPCAIKPGDKIKFKSISKLEYLDIEKRIRNSKFQIKSLIEDA